MDRSIRFLLLILLLWPFSLLSAYAQDEVPPASSANAQQSSNQELINTPVQSIVFGSSAPLRPFPVAGESPAPPLPVPSHFAPPVTDGNFGNLVQILTYKDQFSRNDAEALLCNHGELRVLTTCYIPEPQRIPKDFLRIVPEPKDKAVFRESYEQIGIGNYKSLDADTISEQVLGVAIREGLNIGADIMLFQEGASLLHSAEGFSIGLFNSFSWVNSGTQSEGNGNVSVGGVGFGKGESSYSSKPWLRVQFFRKNHVAMSLGSPQLPQVNSKPGPEQIVLPEGEGRPPTPEEVEVIRQEAPPTDK